MGKRRKRLTMAKYATKYASVREHVMSQNGAKAPEKAVQEVEVPVVESVAAEPTPILDVAQEEPQVVPEVTKDVVEVSPPVEEPKPAKATVARKKRTTTSRKKTTRKKTTAKTTRSSE